MSKLGKLGRVKLLKVYCDEQIEYLTYKGYYLMGTAIYKIGWKKYSCTFVAGERLNFKCAFTDKIGSHYPTERIEREALLTLIYGEVLKYLGKQEMVEYLQEERRKEKEEKWRAEKEKREREIALGEQINIEKYLKNI